jgi:hypothetical protein
MGGWSGGVCVAVDFAVVYIWVYGQNGYKKLKKLLEIVLSGDVMQRLEKKQYCYVNIHELTGLFELSR